MEDPQYLIFSDLLLSYIDQNRVILVKGQQSVEQNKESKKTDTISSVGIWQECENKSMKIGFLFNKWRKTIDYP